MRKFNWACISCGGGFGRKASAKRHANTVHKGYAQYVPWSEYLAGRTSGIYPPSQTPTKGTPKDTPTFFDKMMDSMTEGYFNEIGRILAHQSLTPTSYKLPTFASATPYVATPYFGDNIFGIQVYLCSNCLVTKPSTVCFIEGDKGGYLTYRFYCPPSAARKSAEFGLSMDEFESKVKKYSIEVLAASVVAWMGNQPELIVVEIDDPNRFAGRITFIKKDTDKMFSLTLDYSDNNCIEIDASKTGSWAIRAINNGRTTLDSSELSEFLCMTKTTSYGFFRLSGKPNRTFLMVLVRNGSNTTLYAKKEDIIIAENFRRIPGESPIDRQDRQVENESNIHG